VNSSSVQNPASRTNPLEQQPQKESRDTKLPNFNVAAIALQAAPNCNTDDEGIRSCRSKLRNPIAIWIAALTLLITATAVYLVTFAIAEPRHLEQLAAAGQWFQFALGVPISLFGVVVTGALAWVANEINQKQGDLEALDFVDNRLKELNSSTNILAAELEELYRSLDKAFTTVASKVEDIAMEIDDDAEPQSVPERTLSDDFKKAFDTVIGDPSLANEVSKITSGIKNITRALKMVSESPFSLAILRRSKNSSANDQVAKQFTELTSLISIETDPLSIARSVSDTDPDASRFLDILRFGFFGEVAVEKIFLFGMVFDYELFIANEQLKKSHNIEAILINTGLVELALLNALLPKATDVSSLLGEILPKGRSATRYAELTAADASIAFNNDIAEQLAAVIHDTETCILVLERRDDELTWREYDKERDPKVTQDNVQWTFWSAGDFVTRQRPENQGDE
jgi:hypothetical protein